MKRRVTTNLYDFFTFSGAVDDGLATGEPFRNSVQHLFFNYAYLIFFKSPLTSLMMWRILFKVESLVNGLNLSTATIAMDIIDENMTRSQNSIYCNQCRVVGWSRHPLCRKRYHVIIRDDSSNAIQPYQQRCSRCDNLVRLSEPRCVWCNHETIGENFENWMYLQTKDNTHLLHGVVHANGYGHLLTLKGRECGSILLPGHHIMDFRDRLCETLSVRKVSVMDFSRKFGLEDRLLHAITNGCSWFGNWGYEYGIGSYGLTEDAYQKAVNTLSNMPLSYFFFHGHGPRNRLQCVISVYQSLAETELLTIKDLFSFLIALIRQFHKPLVTKTSEQHGCSSTSNALCAWTVNDVNDVQNAFIKVLLASGACCEEKWVSWRALKGAVCRKFASLELVNYSLKRLGGKTTDNGMVVLSQYNPISSAVEFRLELSSNMQNGFDAISSYHPPKEQIMSDLRFLFASIIHHDKMVSKRSPIMKKLVADSTRKLLDCKIFIKDYKPKQVAAELPPAIRLWCNVELSDRPKGDPSPPPELIILPWNATVADLKREATSVIQQVYVMYKRFQAEKLPEFGPVSDFFTLKFLFGTSGSVRILGKCLAKQWLNRFRMERGNETWEVDCICGAKDDDGERMLECDKCGVWLHTRCAGINNSDDIPSEFVCLRCLNSYPEEAKELQDSEVEDN